MIKNIIFDIGNVLVQNPNFDLVKQFFKEETDAVLFNNYIFKSEFWKEMDLGKITNIEIANKIRDSKLVHVTNYDEADDFMRNWFTKTIANEETMQIGERLKELGYNIYVLSNMAQLTYEYLSSKYSFFKIIDGAVVSAYEGVKKPNEKIFEILLDRYSLESEECLLIDDDDTNKTFEVANSIGIKGRRVQANSSEDVKKSLAENEIII